MRSPDEQAHPLDELAQLARLALSGRPQDVQLFIRRLSKRYREAFPRFAEDLAQLLRDAPTRENPLRGVASASAVPVDLDSRLHLVRLDQGGGLEVEPIWTENVRAALEQLVQERSRQEELARWGLSPTRTVIFTGEPGVGKSLAARWLAQRLHRPLVLLDLSAVMSSFLGRTGANLRHVLDYAKTVECVLFLDELDAVAKRRDDAHELGELKRLVTVLLQEIDDWPASGLLIAATNHPDLLDPAIWRRFDVKIQFPMPDDVAVAAAIRTYLGPSQTLSPAWQELLARLLRGLSFSDIERELTSARRESVMKGHPLEASLQELVRQRMDALPRSERGLTAVALSGLGLSQRQVHEITGVSRDTIRKATKSQDGPDSGRRA